MPQQRLSSRENKVLALLRLNSNLPATEIARRCHLKTHSARYIMSYLKEKNAFQPFLLINPHALGLTDYCFYLNPVGHDNKERSKLIEYCRKTKSISYFTELIGEYQFSISCFTKDIFEAEKTFSDLACLVKHVAWEITFAIRTEWTLISPGYLDNSKSAISMLSRTGPTPIVELDERDRRLLETFSHNPATTFTEVGVRLGMSEGAVRARVAKLTESGVILGFPSLIDSNATGYLPYRVLISVKGKGRELDSELRQFAVSHAYTSDFIRCFGEWDYEINFQVPDPSRAGQITSEIYDRFGLSIHSIRTIAESKTHKLHHYSWG